MARVGACGAVALTVFNVGVAIITLPSLLSRFCDYNDGKANLNAVAPSRGLRTTEYAADSDATLYEMQFYKSLSQDSPTSALIRPDSIALQDRQKWIDAEKRGESVLAWMLTFPNSGTTFTQRVFHALSDSTSVGNYGRGCERSEETGAVVPLHPDDHEGPYLFSLQQNVPRPYALTKTHCGGFCFECAPHDWIETDQSFMSRCATTLWMGTDQWTGEEVAKHYTYSTSKVRRILHVIRDPFDNVVARMRYLHHLKAHDEEWKAQYPKTRTGFREYCEESFRRKYGKAEEQSRFFDSTIVELAHRIPCGIDFYRYIQWHNRAFQTTHALEANDVPALIIHYEDYGTDFYDTVQRLKNFLHTPDSEEHVNLPVFKLGHSYHEYFTAEEIEAAIMLMKETALPATWAKIQHYMQPALEGAFDSVPSYEE